MSTQGTIRIGISGWRYLPWRGTFYPEKLAQRKELEYASRKLNTIEINGTFYSLHRPKSFSEWHDSVPEDFVFSVKGSRYITHMLRLKNAEHALANFFAQGLLRLGSKLGPILWQLPPNFKFDPERLQAFFAVLPRTHKAAARLGSNHDSIMKNRTWLEVEKDRKIRHAIEIRHESFVNEAFVKLLRKHDIALVKGDTVEWPLLMDVTSDFVYCRLHGSEVLYTSGYSEPALATWSARVQSWSQGGEVADGKYAAEKKAPPRSARDVYVYFDNDAKVRAPFDAQNLQQLILNDNQKAVAQPPLDLR